MQKRFGFLTVLLLVVLLGSQAIYAQEATDTPDAGWPVEERCVDAAPDTRSDAIAYVSDEDGTQQIYVMDVEGNHQQKISNLVDAQLDDLDWSPDGKQMVFTNNYHIYRLNIELKSAAQLTDNSRGDYHPAWSPDGRYIAYITSRSGPYDIWLMKPNGANMRQLTYDPRLEMTVRWSPDGKGFGYIPNSGANLQIWVEKEGRDDIFMNFSEDDNGVFHTISDFRWSPNGQYFSLESNFGTYIVKVDGTDLRQIADYDSFGDDSAPSWSPDSCHLVFRLKKEGSEGIYIMDLYDGSLHQLTDQIGWDAIWKP